MLPTGLPQFQVSKWMAQSRIGEPKQAAVEGEGAATSGGDQRSVCGN